MHHVICGGGSSVSRLSEMTPTGRHSSSDCAAFRARRGHRACYAWAVLSNAIHLLLRTGGVPLPTVMRRRYGRLPAGRPVDAQQDPGARHAPENALLLASGSWAVGHRRGGATRAHPVGHQSIRRARRASRRGEGGLSFETHNIMTVPNYPSPITRFPLLAGSGYHSSPQRLSLSVRHVTPHVLPKLGVFSMDAACALPYIHKTHIVLYYPPPILGVSVD